MKRNKKKLETEQILKRSKHLYKKREPNKTETEH